MQFQINGKPVDFSRALPFAKPITEWKTGELRVLDRLGFVLMGRDLTRDSLTYDDLYALVAYFGMKANGNLTPADVDQLTVQEFGKIAGAFVEAFGSRLFPPRVAPSDATPGEKTNDTPFPDGSAGPPIFSPNPMDGNPASSSE